MENVVKLNTNNNSVSYTFVKNVNKKEDLQNGDIVTLRNGDRLMYLDDYFTDLCNDHNNSVCVLNDLDDDLSCHIEKPVNDVMKVERPVRYVEVFERTEKVKEMTLKEVCDALGYEVKIIKEEE